MHKMADNLRVILISGPSHAGKSTLAHSLSLKLGWSRKSTDKLARHPGRPWTINQKPVPEHVTEHYLSLSVDELIEILHARNLLKGRLDGQKWTAGRNLYKNITF